MSKFFRGCSFTIVSLVLLFVHPLRAQFTDDFSDGDFSTNPTWLGNDNKFTVEANQLKLQAESVTSTAYLSTPSAAIDDAKWEFSIRMDFNSSSGNYARVYLAADKANLSASLNGYFVMIGNTPDEVSLYRQTGLSLVRIIDGLDKRIDQSTVNARIKVTRDEMGNWELFTDVGITGSYIVEGSVNDMGHLSSAYTGIWCNYTATRSDKFYFDDFLVTGSPYTIPEPPKWKDILITEIAADPSPPVGLPEAEYIELYNRSSKEYNIANSILRDATSTTTIPNFVLKPGHYVILTSTAHSNSFIAYGSVIALANFPTLNNAGEPIVLKASNGMLIDSVNFKDTWYKSDTKKQGGWSLELIDINNTCGEEDNWIASEDDEGGTPGKENSVAASKPDITGPHLTSAIPLSTKMIKVSFNEKLLSNPPTPEDFFITPSITINSVSFYNSSLREVILLLEDELQSSVAYTIQARNIKDCNGNEIMTSFNQSVFGLPDQAFANDIVINEILFNPLPLGVDFVEIYNVSSKYLNLKNWSLANLQDESIVSKVSLTSIDILLHPNDYLVVTPNAATLKSQYVTGREEKFMTASLPPLPDSEGTIILLDEQGNRIDHLLYEKSMHSSFIKNEEGVSLERVSFKGETNDKQNWKSASATTGYATPGYFNSNARPVIVHESTVHIEPEVFQPLYGYPSFTQIHYNFLQGGYVANVKVYDAQGRMVKVLANNELLGTQGFYRWDGDTEEGTKAKIGYYTVWFEAFSSLGDIKTFRKRVVVAGQF